MGVDEAVGARDYRMGLQALRKAPNSAVVCIGPVVVAWMRSCAAGAGNDPVAQTQRPGIAGSLYGSGANETGADKTGQRRIQVWVLPSSEKPMKPRTSIFVPPSIGIIFTE